MKKIALPAIMAAFCLILLVQARRPSTPKDPMTIDKLSEWFEGVSFSHQKHSGASCEKCHHMGFEGGSGCSSCHPKEKTSPLEVSLKDAYHGVCLPCHTAKGKDLKEGCENCHKARKLAVPKKQVIACRTVRCRRDLGQTLKEHLFEAGRGICLQWLYGE